MIDPGPRRAGGTLYVGFLSYPYDVTERRL